MRKMLPTDHEELICCRDTCDITNLIEASNYMYASSTNGALRQWTLPFDPRKVCVLSSTHTYNIVYNYSFYMFDAGHNIIFLKNNLKYIGRVQSSNVVT